MVSLGAATGWLAESSAAGSAAGVAWLCGASPLFAVGVVSLAGAQGASASVAGKLPSPFAWKPSLVAA
jgi:hypothetical protein